MNLYTTALFAHILGVVVIFMATAIELLCLHRLRSATTTDQLREWATLTKVTGPLFPFGSVAIIVSGLYMAITVWDVTVPWLTLSMTVMTVMSVFGPAVNSRRLDAIAKAAEAQVSGLIPADLARRIQDPLLLVSVHSLAALGFGVVFLKVAKPDLVGSSAALVVALVVAAVSARLASRGRREPAEAKPVSPAVAGEMV